MSATELMCPECCVAVEPTGGHCPHCGLSVEWIGRLQDYRDDLQRRNRDSSREPNPIESCVIEGYRQGTIGFCDRRRLGWNIPDDGDPDIQLDDSRVECCHCLIVRQPETAHFWIIDGSRNGTFVNRQRFTARRLQGGDLLQVGPFAWLFSRDEEEDVPYGYLVPVQAVEGVRLELIDVNIGDRLHKVNLAIGRGEFVAVTGQSGAGKSSLIMAIVNATAYTGRILVDGRANEKCCERIGYVSQDKTLLDDLTLFEAVDFAGRLHGCKAKREQVEEVLRQLDLPKKPCWTNRVSMLSGGEDRRVRVAAELVSTPRLLILDEPASGLDRLREQRLLTMLRGLSYRGCTVIVVTHNLHRRCLDFFDRVLVVANRQIAFDGSPQELRRQSPTGDLEDADLRFGGTDGAVSEHVRPPIVAYEHPGVRKTFGARLMDNLGQFRTLLRREVTVIKNAWFNRLILPAIVVPAVFAGALHLSVKEYDLSLLGFLSVLVAIWMGASLSLMSIVAEREVYDHERLTFLKIVPYLGAKLLVLGLISAFQTVWFLRLLALMQSQSERKDAMLCGWEWCLIPLILAGWASVGMGMLISAFSGRHRHVASLILPLVMMAQILFSSHVASQGDAPLTESYRDMHDKQPWADRLSRLTISRYGDEALRSFAYSEIDYRDSNLPNDSSRYHMDGYAGRRWLAYAWLIGIGLACAVFCGIVLRIQEVTARSGSPGLIRRLSLFH